MTILQASLQPFLDPICHLSPADALRAASPALGSINVPHSHAKCMWKRSKRAPRLVPGASLTGSALCGGTYCSSCPPCPEDPRCSCLIWKGYTRFARGRFGEVGCAVFCRILVGSRFTGNTHFPLEEVGSSGGPARLGKCDSSGHAEEKARGGARPPTPQAPAPTALRAPS